MKGSKETEEIVEEMKERDREERGTGMKVKKQNKNIPPLPSPATRSCPTVSQYQLAGPGDERYMTPLSHPLLRAAFGSSNL